MRLDRTEVVLSAVEAAAAGGAMGGMVESFLAQYVSVVLYSEMEEKLSDLMRTRLSHYTHEAIAAFIANSFGDMMKRTPKSDIAKFSNRFGEVFKQSFNGLVDDKEVTRYSNVIEARHDVGHKRGSNITLAEVRTGLGAANHILDALETSFDNVCGPLK